MNEDADVQKMLADVILYKVDAEKGEGPELKKTHGVSGYPTFILANNKLEPMDRWVGYSKDMLNTNLTSALADQTTIDEKKARFEKSPTAKDAVKLADLASAMGEYDNAVGLYGKAASLNPDNHYASEVFDVTFSGSRRGAEGFDFPRVQKAATHALEHSTSDTDIMRVSTRMIAAAKQAENHDVMVSYLKTAIEKTKSSEDESVVKSRKNIMPSYALHVEKNEAKAVELKKASFGEDWMDDAGALNGYAWWAFENGVDTKNALELAMKGIELSPAGKEKAMVLDTAAELCNSLKNCARSVELTEMAIAEDPESKFYPEQLVRFQEALAKQ